ncbi:MAG: hypothetical protein LBH58_02260 [Tannerellaceae bacterium]|jgi:hypothetical protein|nr:hypothetical protein [Tannerellaceae bacterium]
MKNILFITSFLFIYLFFMAPDEETANRTSTTAGWETTVHEKDIAKDMRRHRVEIISNDFKNRDCLTPRRNVQTSYAVSNQVKILRHTIRSLQDLRIKETGQLQKTNEFVTECQTLNYSSLLTRRGYHVYALRKIVI